MNLALPAILIFLLILPGIFFALSFYKTPENKPINYIPLTHKAIFSFFITLLFHISWILIIYLCSTYEIDFKNILILLSGAQSNLYNSAINSISPNKLMNITIYLVTMYCFAYILGAFLRYLIKKFKLDKKFKFFRLESQWYYLFAGYDWEDSKQVDGVIIAATIEFAGRGYLYLGYLDDFFLDENGNIDRLILTSVWRRHIDRDKKIPNHNESSIDNNQKISNSDNSFLNRFYSIDGDYFVLKYSEIKNLNVQFLKIIEQKFSEDTIVKSKNFDLTTSFETA